MQSSYFMRDLYHECCLPLAGKAEFANGSLPNLSVDAVAFCPTIQPPQTVFVTQLFESHQSIVSRCGELGSHNLQNVSHSRVFYSPKRNPQCGIKLFTNPDCRYLLETHTVIIMYIQMLLIHSMFLVLGPLPIQPHAYSFNSREMQVQH